MPRPKLRQPRYALKLRGRFWTLTWTDPESSRTRAVSTGQTNEAQAKIWRDQFLAGLEQGAPPPQPLLRDILDGYLRDRKPRVAAYERLEFAAAVIKRHIGNLQPHMLVPQSYLERRAKEGVSDGTIRREIGVLRAALAWSTRQQPPWIDRAPAIEAPPSPEPRERWLTREEVDRLVAACRSSHVRLFVLLAYHTAARAGAILELTWDRVDFDNLLIDYRRPGRRRTNKRRATVRLNRVIVAALQEARQVAIEDARRKGEKPAAYVIEHRGRSLLSIRKGFSEACRRAGIAGCTPHTLRHTAATHMVMQRVRLAEIARMLGDSEAVVERVYGKHSPDYLRDAADALAGELGPRLVSQTVSEK